MTKERKSIRVNTGDVNRYGYRILSEGIALKYFKLNPIMFYNHHRTWRGEKGEMLPIGKWENLRIEKGALLADPVFDEDDEFAMKIKGKFEKGILNTASVNVWPIETSDAKEHLLKGQKRPTVTKSELREISIVDIPGNGNAVVLCSEHGSVLELSDGQDSPLPLIDQKPKLDKMENLQLFALALGMSGTPTLYQVIAHAKQLVTDNAALKLSGDKFETSNKLMLKEAEDALKLKAETLVDKAIDENRIKKTEREVYLKYAQDNFELTEQLLASKQGKKTLEDDLGDKGSLAVKMGFTEMSKKNPKGLLKLKQEDTEEYKELFKEEFEEYPKNMK